MTTLSNDASKQRQLWERFAEVDACRDSMTELPTGSPKEFWDSGEVTVREELLQVVENFNVPHDRCLEIGCGVGRLLLPLSRTFKTAVGVDISKGMLVRAQRAALDRGIHNAEFDTIAEPTELNNLVKRETGSVTFVYSLLVFQHIPDFETIESYISAMARVLDTHGVAYVQFDTRKESKLYRTKTALPDFVLPRFWRRGVRRIRRNPRDIERAFARNGLTILAEKWPGSAEHRYVLGLSSRNNA